MKSIFLILVILSSYGLSAQLKGKVTYRLETIKDSVEQPFEGELLTHEEFVKFSGNPIADK